MKYLSIVRYVLMAISFLLIVLGMMGIMTPDAFTDMLLKWMYAVMGVAILCVIVFPAWTLSQNPKGAKRSLIGLLALVAILGICYAFSNDAPVITAGAEYTNSFELKVTDMGLYTTYIALAGALLTIIFCEVRNSFK